MIVDSHCHAWARWPYEPQVPDPDSRGRAEQLLFEMDQNGVDKAVVICANIGGNTHNNEYVAGEAAKHAGRLFAFPDIDCSWSETYHRPGAACRLRETALRLNIRGFTHYLRPEVDDWMSSADGTEFLAAAQELRLIASMSAGPRWLPEIRKVAAAFPELPIILHHRGGLRPRSETYEADAAELEQMARLDNIYVKASGFYYGSAEEWDFPYTDSIESFRRIYDAFGARRLCWGSDFPVCQKGRSTYRQTIEVVRTHCSFIPPDDAEWIMGRTMDELLTTRR